MGGFDTKNNFLPASLTIFDQVMVSGVNFATNILLARLLGLTAYGAFSIVWIIVLLLSNLQLSLIIDPLMTLYPMKVSDEKPYFMGGLILQQLVFSFLSLLLVFGGVGITSSILEEASLQSMKYPAAVAVFFTQMQDFVRRFYFVTDRPYKAFCNDVLSYIGQLTIFLVFFAFPLVSIHVEMVFWVIATTSAIAVLAGSRAFRSGRYQNVRTREAIVSTWKFSKWLSISKFLQVFSTNFYLLVASKLFGLAAVGGIRASQNLVGLLRVFYQGLNNYIPKEASTTYLAWGSIGLVSFTKRVATRWGLFFLVLTFTLIARSEFIIERFYGHEYTPYSWTLVWLGIAMFINFFEIPLHSYLRTLGKTRAIFKATFFMALSSLFMAYPLALTQGLNGIVIGITISTMIMIGMSWMACRGQVS